MVTKKEFLVKKQMVELVHVTRNGTLRTINRGNPSSSYPNGYMYTKMEGGKLVKAKDLEGLYTRLYDLYYGSTDTFSVKNIFVKAIEDKRLTENPKENTLMRYRTAINWYLTDEMQNTDIRTVTDHDLKAYTQQMVQRECMTKKSFLTYKSLLNLIFGYAYANGIIDKNPV